MALCQSCAHTFECPNCAISLTLHGKSHLVCHYCDYSEQLKESCPACESTEIETIGLGTEQIQDSLQVLFPTATIARADRDEISNRSDMEDLISDMESGQIDILVGTQMIAKGLDFPRLKVVGLALADIGMNLPDFRATEKSFQLMTQMSGRAGRHGTERGQVIVQTFNPEHPSLQYALNADFEGFAEMELEERKLLRYPPYGKLALLKLTAKNHQLGLDLCDMVQARCQQLKAKEPRYEKIQVLGPCPAPLAKLRNQYRFQILLKAPLEPWLLQGFCAQILGQTSSWKPGGTKVQVDIDPLVML